MKASHNGKRQVTHYVEKLHQVCKYLPKYLDCHVYLQFTGPGHGKGLQDQWFAVQNTYLTVAWAKVDLVNRVKMVRDHLLAQHEEQGTGKSYSFVIVTNLNAVTIEWAPFVETKFTGLSDSFCIAGTRNPDNSVTLWDFTFPWNTWAEARVLQHTNTLTARPNPDKPVQLPVARGTGPLSRQTEKVMANLAKKGYSDPSLGDLYNEAEGVAADCLTIPPDVGDPAIWAPRFKV